MNYARVFVKIYETVMYRLCSESFLPLSSIFRKYIVDYIGERGYMLLHTGKSGLVRF